MRRTTGLTVALLAAVASAFAVGAAPALANGEGAVFVQNDGLASNQVVAYDRSPGGALTQVGVYNTGGLGGALEGSVVDHLASQGSLLYDREDNLLYAVNAGSNTVSVFAVFGDRLALRQVISSGGSFPVSIAAHDGLVYVLNALDGGSVQGFAVVFGRLVALPGSNRALGLNPAATPPFTNTPGTVVFSPDGSQLIVTTKKNGNDVDVFQVEYRGELSASPVVNPLPETVPFAITFDREQRLILAESAGALGSFQLNANGTLEQLDVVPSGQIATCWVTEVRGVFYTSNPGSSSLSAYKEGFGGALTLLGDTPTDGGTVDSVASPDGRFLYVQTGAEGLVDEFAVAPNGALSKIGWVSVPDAVGGEGIAAS